MKSYELSPAALRALNEMREDYEFQDGPKFLDDVLEVLEQLADLTIEERALLAELRMMPPEGRASLSRAIRATFRNRNALRGPRTKPRMVAISLALS